MFRRRVFDFGQILAEFDVAGNACGFESLTRAVNVLFRVRPKLVGFSLHCYKE